MKVKVDSEKCQGHNRCYALAPGLFKVDEDEVEAGPGDVVLVPAMAWHSFGNIGDDWLRVVG